MKKKNSTRILLLATAALALIAIVFSGMLLLNYIKNYGVGDKPPVKYTTELYEVPNTPTEYQLQLYDELAKKCNDLPEEYNADNMAEIAPLVVSSFVTDYFTWSNKRGSYDVGGLNYVYSPSHLNISSQSRYYFYYDVDILMEQYGVENLPTVASVEILSCEKQASPYIYTSNLYDYDKEEYVYTDIEYDAYLVSATWQYATNEVYDTSKMPNHGNFLLIFNQNRLEIAYYHENY